MSDNALAVQIRDETGKGMARKLRRQGRIPAVLYGHGNVPTPLSLDPRELERILRTSEAGINTLIDLAGAEAVAGRMALLKEIQRDPVRGDAVHADLLEVSYGETVQVSVPIHLQGTPKGVQLSGGILDQVLREIEVECMLRAIPDEIVIDVSDLDLGDSVHLRDLPLPDGVEIRGDLDLSVASVAAPTVAEEPEEEVAAEEGEAPEEAAPPPAED